VRDGDHAVSNSKNRGDEMLKKSFADQLDLLIAKANDQIPEETSHEEEEREAIQAECVEPDPVEPDPDPEPVELEPVDQKETKEQKARRLDLQKPLVGAISTQKMVHGSMVLNDICVECARCKLKLTDATSVERGMGPECSSKGYAEEVKDSDEIQAMIELSEYPVLVEFLVQHYKPHGVRGLMNGLVRIAALNRKTPAHAACANAIEALGYRRLAATLRDSLAIMWIRESKRHPGHYHVRVRGREWTRAWSYDCYKNIPHCFFDKVEKGLIVSKHPQAKRALWNQMIKHYGGFCVKTENGTVRIPTEEEREASRTKKVS
jgi:hypothetical protein